LDEIVPGQPPILIRIFTRISPHISHPQPMHIASTLLKVFGLSLAIALLIKYAIAPFTIPNNDTIALAIVLLPTVLMTGVLSILNSEV
jgi:hypothetical protein